VDHAQKGLTHVVRSADLWQSPSRQMLLQHALGYPSPRYAHVPIITNTQGQKLSKQTLAQAIEAKDAPSLLFEVLTLLNQAPPATLKDATSAEILHWATTHWQIVALPKQAIMRA